MKIFELKVDVHNSENPEDLLESLKGLRDALKAAQTADPQPQKLEILRAKASMFYLKYLISKTSLGPVKMMIKEYLFLVDKYSYEFKKMKKILVDDLVVVPDIDDYQEVLIDMVSIHMEKGETDKAIKYLRKSYEFFRMAFLDEKYSISPLATRVMVANYMLTLQGLHNSYLVKEMDHDAISFLLELFYAEYSWKITNEKPPSTKTIIRWLKRSYVLADYFQMHSHYVQAERILLRGKTAVEMLTERKGYLGDDKALYAVHEWKVKYGELVKSFLFIMANRKYAKVVRDDTRSIIEENMIGSDNQESLSIPLSEPIIPRGVNSLGRLLTGFNLGGSTEIVEKVFAPALEGEVILSFVEIVEATAATITGTDEEMLKILASILKNEEALTELFKISRRTLEEAEKYFLEFGKDLDYSREVVEISVFLDQVWSVITVFESLKPWANKKKVVATLSKRRGILRKAVSILASCRGIEKDDDWVNIYWRSLNLSLARVLEKMFDFIMSVGDDAPKSLLKEVIEVQERVIDQIKIGEIPDILDEDEMENLRFEAELLVELRLKNASIMVGLGLQEMALAECKNVLELISGFPNSLKEVFKEQEDVAIAYTYMVRERISKAINDKEEVEELKD